MDALAELPLPLEAGHEAALEGRVGRMIYDPNSGDMRIFELSLEDGGSQTVVQYANGSEMIPLRKGDGIKAYGKITVHKTFGKRFQARDVVRVVAASGKGIAKVISGKAFKGIGPKAAQKIVDQIGDDLISVLNRRDPGELLSDIIGAKKAEALLDAWHVDQAAHNVDSLLAGLDIGDRTRKKIRETIPDIETVIYSDPYRIGKEVEGIGFLTSDKIAQKAGVFRPDAPQRLAVGVAHTLDEAAKEGHTGLSRSQLLDKTCDILEFGDRAAIARIIDREIEQDNLYVSPNDLVQTRWTAQRETRLARRLIELALAEPPRLDPVSVARHLRRIKADHQLNDKQFEAVAATLDNSLVIVTGGPGTGKTRTEKAIIDLHKSIARDSNGACEVLQMAPSGKAADRMSEATGHDASTVHMALGRDRESGKWAHDSSDPFTAHLMIGDEYSMMDTRLADAQTQAVRPGATRSVIVGDIHQLPSVDAGRVLQDLIESGICPVIQFTEVYRTGPGSAINIGADDINHGRMPTFSPPGKGDFVFAQQEDKFDVQARIVSMVSKGIPAASGIDPSRIQVLCPMKPGPCGTIELNRALQEALNPAAPITWGRDGRMHVVVGNGIRLRLGDRVICTKTVYSKDDEKPDVFNGDVGVVEAFEIGDEDVPQIVVRCSRKTLVLEQSYWVNVQLSYAMTIHKSQGSEYEVVVIPMHTTHYMMLRRNLFYTGVTRAKLMCVVVGTKQAVKKAIDTLDGTTRQTGLLSRIRKFWGMK